MTGEVVSLVIDIVESSLTWHNLAGDDSDPILSNGRGLIGNFDEEIADLAGMFADKDRADGVVDDILVKEAEAAIGLPRHIALGIVLLVVVGELSDSLLERHLISGEESLDAIGESLGLSVGARDITAGALVKDIDTACAETIGALFDLHNAGHDPLVAGHLRGDELISADRRDKGIERSREFVGLFKGRVIAMSGDLTDEERYLLDGCLEELVIRLGDALRYFLDIFGGRSKGVGHEAEGTYFIIKTELGLMFVIILLEIGIGRFSVLIRDRREGEASDADIGAGGGVRSKLSGERFRGEETLSDKGSVFLLLAVLFDILFEFDPLQTSVSVELFKVVDIIFHSLYIILTGLRVGEKLTYIRMDKEAGVHIAHFGRRDSETESLVLFAEDSFVDDVLPDLIAEFVFDIGRDLFDALLAFVVILHFLDEGVEMLSGDSRAVNFADIGEAALIFGQVADDKSDNSDADEGNSYPGMFSNTSNNTHINICF